jgi:hypothetical protein
MIVEVYPFMKLIIIIMLHDQLPKLKVAKSFS